MGTAWVTSQGWRKPVSELGHILEDSPRVQENSKSRFLLDVLESKLHERSLS